MNKPVAARVSLLASSLALASPLAAVNLPIPEGSGEGGLAVYIYSRIAATVSAVLFAGVWAIAAILSLNRREGAGRLFMLGFYLNVAAVGWCASWALESFRGDLRVRLLLGEASARDDAEVKAVIDKAVKALGVEAALAKAGAYSARERHLRLLGDGRSFEYTAKATVQGVDRSRTESYSPDQPGAPGELTSVSVLNGGDEWIKGPGEAAVKYDDGAVIAADRQAAVEQAAAVNLAPLRDGSLRVEPAGEVDVGGEPASALKATGPGGRSFTIAFAKAERPPRAAGQPGGGQRTGPYQDDDLPRLPGLRRLEGGHATRLDRRGRREPEADGGGGRLRVQGARQGRPRDVRQARVTTLARSAQDGGPAPGPRRIPAPPPLIGRPRRGRITGPPQPGRSLAMNRLTVIAAVAASVSIAAPLAAQDKPTRDAQGRLPDATGAGGKPTDDSPANAKAAAAPQGGPAEDEIAGTVVDERGEPIEGVLVDVWDWYPGNEARTDARGRFRLSVSALDDKGRKRPGGFDRKQNLEVRFLKEGYSPVLILDRKPGTDGWDVTMDARTYFEGKLTAPDGRPVADALIRADQGPKSANRGYTISQIWTETRSGPDGRYRLYVAPDGYRIEVRVPGVGAARLRATAGKGEAQPLDIGLTPGVAFRARAVDAQTGEPVAGVRLHHWQYKGIEGTSDANGNVTIDAMFPGKFVFQVGAPGGYARWWSEQGASEWARRQVLGDRGGWQRNFDGIDFELGPDAAPVTIKLERGVTIQGAVLDPDGKPVAGATVAPALTGTGNSITGDTRYSVETGEDGRYAMLLPASNARDYNLVAHDGAYRVWRRWANGVLNPIHTRPGQALDDVTLLLERPATVRGRVRDAAGRPAARREVRACGTDQLDNRYYVPTVETDAEGRFELKFVRPGENYVQVAPFWLDPRQAPAGASQTVKVQAGQVKEGVDLVGPDRP